MTLREALLASKASSDTLDERESYMRVTGGGGFVRWCDETCYEFTADDICADDWESVKTGIPRLTGGKWEAA